MAKHVHLKTITLKNHQEYNERWLQEVIASDPGLLGIGDVALKDRERIQPGAGRLDLLFQEVEGYGRYEVEIQLGPTDESHSIRTIEYWDLEKKRYPQYDHTAVIIAENITSRFLNVISLFNGFIPIMALQLSAIETPEGVGLHFAKILDTQTLGYLDEDEDVAEPTDRNYWETKRGTPQTVKMADAILNSAKEFAPTCELSYNKYYIGFRVNGKPCNFAICRAQKSGMRLEIALPRDEEIDQQLDEVGFEVLDYDNRGRRYRLKLREGDIKKHPEVLSSLLKQAYDRKC
jgi:predicted transport protein